MSSRDASTCCDVGKKNNKRSYCEYVDRYTDCDNSLN